MIPLPGVDDVDIDMAMQKVTVMGWADQMKVLKTVRKTGRRAELWPFPYNPEYHDFTNHYYATNYNQPQQEYHNYQSQNNDETVNYYSLSSHSDQHQLPIQAVSSYNYREHGYNGHDHGYYHQPPHLAMFDERTSNLFNDDNPHACSVM